MFVIKGVPVFLIGLYKKQQQINALCYTYYDAGFRFPIVGLCALIFPIIPTGIFLYCKKHYLNKWLDKVNWVVTISSTVKRKCSFTYLQHPNRKKYSGRIHSSMYEYGWRSYIWVVYSNRSDAFSKVRTNMYIELTMEWRSKMLWDVSATNSEIANTVISKFTYNTLIIIFYYIHTEKYSPKIYVVNFRRN